MVIVYTQDGTYVRPLYDSKALLIEVYGNKLGEEAFIAASSGKDYRKNGGPLVKPVSKADAELIISKERAAGLLVE